jgi:DnaJ-class molecular chaperone
MECPECHGSGYVIEEYIELDPLEYPCWFCNEKGTINIFKWLYFKIRGWI